MRVEKVKFSGIDGLLILEVGKHELQISYDNTCSSDHEVLIMVEHLKDGKELVLAAVDLTTVQAKVHTVWDSAGLKAWNVEEKASS